MKKNTRKAIYFMSFFAIAALIAMGFLVMPNFNNSGTVSAQKAGANAEVATTDMLFAATNIRSAGSFAVFADKSISDVGNSQIKGNVGVAGKNGQISLDRATVLGSTYADPSDALRAQSDLASSFNFINQLPCTELADSQLGGKKFAPGVYCVSSAVLAGQIVLDADNDASGVFIFRVAGSFNTKDGASVELINKAASGNVYFIAGDSVNVGKNSDFKGNIFAENNVKVDNGSTINGRILSLKGGVELDGASVVLADGFVEICKVVDPATAGAADLTGRIFRFTIPGVNGGNPIEVQANQCAGPFLVSGAGNIVITEQNVSRLPGSATLRTGNFRLVDVRQINRQQGSANAVTGSNLAGFTANVTVPMGGINDQVTIQFTNEFAVMGFIEICKFGNDLDVGTSANGSIFQFVVIDVPQFPANNQVFSVPVGGCAGPIGVIVPSNGTGTPRSGTASVFELKKVGFFFETATTDPSERLLNIFNYNAVTTGGLAPFAARVDATIFEATDTRNQTRFNFFNRTNPAQVKICKVAGPGIPEGALFSFTVTGTRPTNFTNNQVPDVITNAAFGTAAVSRTFTVAAGLSSNNGGCRFVPNDTDLPTSQQLFVVGTNVTITENGPTLTPNNESIRVGRITSTSGFTTIPSATCGTASGAAAGTTIFPPTIDPTVAGCRTVTVPVRRQVVEVEYTNFVFLPGSLKICKIAGAGVNIGDTFTFDVSFDRNQGIFPNAVSTNTRTLTVAAGPASQGGFCQVVNGPFTPGFGNNGVGGTFGTFNVGSIVTITERVSGATTVTGIRSTSGATVTPNLAGRTTTAVIQAGTLNNNIFTPGTTEVEFVNTVPTAPEPTRASTAYDFDGDKKADISVFRDGNWYLNRSGLGFTAAQFGAKNDKLVPADYDGDKKADIAVFRAVGSNGIFYITNSSDNAFRWVQFGISTDVPVVGDYDGDGKADIAVYRDGKNNGDASYIYYRPSGTSGADFVTIQLGAKGDIPVVGDYDGDKRADAAVYRPSNGTWYMLGSTAGFSGVQFGISTDVPVPADYDGDGKTDVAVYRGGTWYLLQSSKGFTGIQFGAATDMPVPADIDGDGKDDIAVFRAGTWYWLNSKDGSFTGMNFGLGSDVPVFCPAIHQ